MKKTEFSKTLLIQESVLIWIVTLSCLALSAYCIYMGFLGSLAWLSTVVSVSWAAYGISQTMYYKKAMAENTSGGIKYETVLKEAEDVRQYYSDRTFTTEFDDIAYTYTATEDVDSYQI